MMLKKLALLFLLSPYAAQADVYPDTVNQRRTPTTEEQQHLLHLGVLGQSGCSASALTPDTIITAEHCLPLRLDGFDLDLAKGYFEFDPSQTFSVVSEPVSAKSKKRTIKPLDVSSHYANDVLIVKIKWDSGKAPSALRYPRELAHTENQLKFSAESDALATPLFILGYPRDREKRATFSSGYVKAPYLIPRSTGKIDPYTQDRTLESLYLSVNVPLTNGNSGGPVYTENFKLVGIVHGGSLTMESEQTGSDFNSQNPKFWNHVGALYYVYPQMKTLQAIFPNGVNPNVSERGEWIGK